jgi:hypothetical protein
VTATLVLATNPSFVRTFNTSALLTGFVRTALKSVPSSVIWLRSCAAYDVTATIGVSWLAFFVDLIILAAFSPSTKEFKHMSAQIPQLHSGNSLQIGISYRKGADRKQSVWSATIWYVARRARHTISINITSKASSPMEHLIASSPLWTTTQRQPNRTRMVSKILEEMGSGKGKGDIS